jgi:hypothetical protein
MITNEYILCAAIWYKELPSQVHRPKNVDKGVVVCGHRHGHCISTLVALSGLRSVQFAPDGVGEYIQGFLTNTNRFVDRMEAMDIAFKAEQILVGHQLYNPTIGLFSEDLY